MPRKSKCQAGSIPTVRLKLEQERCLQRIDGPILNNPRAIAEFVHDNYGCEPQEHFLALAFNANNELLTVHEVALGGFAQAPVDPSVVFSGALLSGASAIILVHNHPSGKSEASLQDIDLTARLARGAEYLGLRVLDHVIVARGEPLSYYSFVERGTMPTAKLSEFGDEEIEYGELDGLDAVRISGKPPREMTAGQINKELDRLDAESSRVNGELIAAGRGHVRASETWKMTDPLSLEWRAVAERQMSLRNEIAARYGPGAPFRLPRGFGPRRMDGIIPLIPVRRR